MLSVATRTNYSLVILSGGELWSAGCNNCGQLGIGNETSQRSFVKVDLGGKRAMSVAAGGLHSLVILEGGELWSAGCRSAGNNDYGQLGIGNKTGQSSPSRMCMWVANNLPRLDQPIVAQPTSGPPTTAPGPSPCPTVD